MSAWCHACHGPHALRRQRAVGALCPLELSEPPIIFSAQLCGTGAEGGALHALSVRQLRSGFLVAHCRCGTLGAVQRLDGETVAVADLDHVVIRIMEEDLGHVDASLHNALFQKGDTPQRQLAPHIRQAIRLQDPHSIFQILAH